MQTWNDVFAAFPSVAAIAALLNVPYQTAAAWRRRNSIPSRYWLALAEAATTQGITGISVDALSRIEAASAAQPGAAA
jgi:hypothetical protein